MEVLTAVEQLAAARARESVGRAAVMQARESQRIVRDRFEAGLRPTSDVIRVATAVLDAEALRVRAVVDVMVGEAALRRAVGRRRGTSMRTRTRLRLYWLVAAAALLAAACGGPARPAPRGGTDADRGTRRTRRHEARRENVRTRVAWFELRRRRR